MSNKLTAEDVRRMLKACDKMTALTDMIRRNLEQIPSDVVGVKELYDAVSGTETMRDILLRASLSDVVIEQGEIAL